MRNFSLWVVAVVLGVALGLAGGLAAGYASSRGNGALHVTSGQTAPLLHGKADMGQTGAAKELTPYGLARQYALGAEAAERRIDEAMATGPRFGPGATGIGAAKGPPFLGMSAADWEIRRNDVLKVREHPFVPGVTGAEPPLVGVPGSAVEPGRSESKGLGEIIVTGPLVQWSALLDAIAFTGLLGDVSLDGAVTIQDMALIARHFGKPPPRAQPWIDLDGDGVVGFSDLALISKILALKLRAQ